MILIHGVPVYWGIETDAVDRSFWTRATLNEVLPPYRESYQAVRIRLSHKHWLHVGLFRYRRELRPWGIPVPPAQIGNWGRDQKGQEAAGVRADANGAAGEAVLAGSLPGGGDSAGEDC